MPAQLSIHATERSTYIVTASFTDEDGDAVTPKSVIWTLSDSAGNIVNDREAVSETPAASVAIVLSGGDLIHADDNLPRVITVEAVYDSATYGDNLYLKSSIEFLVDNLVIALGCDKVFEDEEGASFWPNYPGLIKLDGSAAVRFEGTDITPWKGTAGSETPYIIRLHDSAGKTVWGFLAEADAALAFGAEQLTNIDFELNEEWTAQGSTVSCAQYDGGADPDGIGGAHAGTYCWKVVVDAVNEGVRGSTMFTPTEGFLYKATAWVYVALGECQLAPYTGALLGLSAYPGAVSTTTGSWEKLEVYIVATGTAPDDDTLWVRGKGIADSVFYVDDVSIKPVTALGADGCHIVNTKDGSIQNWADREAGFNYNDPSGYTFEIMNACYVL